MSDNENRSPIDVAGPWIAMCAAVGLTATGEYQLAQLAGWGAIIAALLPTAVDVYVVVAIRAHRDVASAILMMIATNALYHLAAANLFGTDGRPGHLAWWLIVAVTAVAPMVLWRIHRIMPRRSKETDERHAASATERPTAAPRNAPQGAPAAAPIAPQTLPQSATQPTPVASQAAPQSAPVASAGAPQSTAQSATKAPRKAAKAAPPKRPGKGPRAAAKDAIRDLYDDLGRRPLESEMVAALVAIKSPHTSRQFANKLRAEIEKEDPQLAALGQENVTPMTGTGA